MPLNLPYNVGEQVVIISREPTPTNPGCANYIGVVDRIIVDKCCNPNSTGTPESVKYKVCTEARVPNMCNPEQSSCVCECCEYCAEQLRPVVTPAP